jgi:1,4-dihydroxy-2-naphthoate octaprenyltransferase
MSDATVQGPAEPQRGAYRHPLSMWFHATRPAFLTATFSAWLMGTVSSIIDGLQVRPLTAAVTLLFALVAHAGVNVLNDYYDAIDGVDTDNAGRIFPFTGGSRFIQNGVMSLPATARLGYGLLALVVPAGLWLTWQSGAGLLLIGAAGLFIGWAYSARPLSLMRHGWGEVCVTAGMLLIVVGSDFVQRGAFAESPLLIGLPFALLATNILFLNQFPDCASDALAGKRHWVVRLGPRRALWIYVVIAALAYAGWLAMLLMERLPAPMVIALLPALASAFAVRELVRFAAQPARLAPAIRATIAAALAHAALAATGLGVHAVGVISSGAHS